MSNNLLRLDLDGLRYRSKAPDVAVDGAAVDKAVVDGEAEVEAAAEGMVVADVVDMAAVDGAVAAIDEVADALDGATVDKAAVDGAAVVGCGRVGYGCSEWGHGCG